MPPARFKKVPSLILVTCSLYHLKTMVHWSSIRTKRKRAAPAEAFFLLDRQRAHRSNDSVSLAILAVNQSGFNQHVGTMSSIVV